MSPAKHDNTLQLECLKMFKFRRVKILKVTNLFY